MALFPIIMLMGYLGIIFYFKSKGGYKAIELEEGEGSGGGEAPPAADETVAKGPEGPSE